MERPPRREPQGGEWPTVVTLHDGTTEELHLQGTEPSPWDWGYAPITGFIGYTADPGRTIADVYSWGFDGGVDDVRIGLAEARAQVDTARNQLDALVSEIAAQSGNHLTTEQADELLGCIEARLEGL